MLNSAAVFAAPAFPALPDIKRILPRRGQKVLSNGQRARRGIQAIQACSFRENSNPFFPAIEVHVERGAGALRDGFFPLRESSRAGGHAVGGRTWDTGPTGMQIPPSDRNALHMNNWQQWT